MNEILKLAQDQKWEDLISVMDTQSTTQSFEAKEFLMRAFAAFGLKNYYDAYGYATKAFEMDGNLAEAASFLASLCVMVGRSKESYYYRKLLSILEENDELKPVIPEGFIPDYSNLLSEILEKPLMKKGIDQEILQNWDLAEHWYQQHISFEPYDKEGYIAIVRLLITQERYRAASDTLKGARAIFPQEADFSSLMGDVLCTLGEFDAATACYDWAIELSPYDEKVHLRKLRGMVQDPFIKFDECVDAFKVWQEKHVQEIRGAMQPPVHGPRSQLRIGFLMKGLDRTRIAPAIGSVLAWHDSTRYHMIGYGEGEITFPLNRYFKSSFSQWRDIMQTDAMTLRNMIVADEIDILIDMGGLVSSETMSIFGSRMAPVQAAWSQSNLPGLLDQVDYVLSDRCQDVLSDKHLAIEFSSVFSACRELLDEELIKPDARMTFGVDANFVDLNYQSIALWARLLLANPEAILLLRSHDFFAKENSRKLIEQFGNFGLAHRVDVIEEADRRLFFAQCDVALMPSQSAPAEIVLDALSARKPIVGCLVYDQHLSKSNDVIMALGLKDDLLAENLDDYVALASRWIGDGEKRAQFAQTAADILSSHSFFNEKERMGHIAQTFEEMWEKAGS